MISVDGLIKEVSSLKVSSEQLSFLLSAAGQELQSSTNMISTIVQGSRTGQDAVVSLGAASKSLLDASASIKTLERTCDECVAILSR